MGALKTVFAAPIVAIALAGPGKATEDFSRKFASCVGRLSAQMEHHWLLGDPRSDQVAKQRMAMITLLDAVSHETPPEITMARRIEAKAAHATLLRRATFNRDGEDARWALQRAESEISACVGVLLG